MLLAIGTAHAACSVALIDGPAVIARRHVLVGRGHAERLVPMIAEVLAEGGRPAAVVADVGPGSFTGIRVGVAAARALALAWAVPVHGFSSTALVAAAAFAADGALDEVTVALDAGRGELFIERFDRTLASRHAPLALGPRDAAAFAGTTVAGTGAAALADAAPGVRIAGEAPPDAADVRLLPELWRALPPGPVYVRAPDATLPPA